MIGGTTCKVNKYPCTRRHTCMVHVSTSVIFHMAWQYPIPKRKQPTCGLIRTQHGIPRFQNVVQGKTKELHHKTVRKKKHDVPNQTISFKIMSFQNRLCIENTRLQNRLRMQNMILQDRLCIQKHEPPKYTMYPHSIWKTLYVTSYLCVRACIIK